MLYHEDYMNDTITGALVSGVLPALIAAIQETAQKVTAEVVTDRTPTAVDAYLTRQALTYCLLEYLDNSKQDPGRDWNQSSSHPRSIYELEDLEFARQWFVASVESNEYPDTIIDDIVAESPPELTPAQLAHIRAAIASDEASHAAQDASTQEAK